MEEGEEEDLDDDEVEKEESGPVKDSILQYCIPVRVSDNTRSCKEYPKVLKGFQCLKST